MTDKAVRMVLLYGGDVSGQMMAARDDPNGDHALVKGETWERVIEALDSGDEVERGKLVAEIGEVE